MSALQSYANFVGTMARSFRISKGGPTLIPGTIDPNANAVSGNTGDIYILTGSSPNFYQNIGGTAWKSLVPTTPAFTRTPVTTGSYTVLASDYYIGVNYAGPVTINLPAGVTNTSYVIKDESGNAAAHPITVVAYAANSETIDNNATVVMDVPYASISLVFANEWHLF